MFTSCIQKQEDVKKLFSCCDTEEKKYQKIIELGRELPKISEKYKIPDNIVKGCQSIVYLGSRCEDGKVYYEAESEALISSGLAALLLYVYNGENPEAIIQCPPTYLDELGIGASLTPNRANGLYSIHLKIKQDALKHLLEVQAKLKNSVS